MNRRYVYSVVFSAILLIVLLYRGVLFSNRSFDFPERPSESHVMSSLLKFAERAHVLGVDVVFRSNWPNPNIQQITKKLRRLPPSIAFGDLDNDGYQDLFVVNGELDYGGVRIFRNEDGRRFAEITTTVLDGISTDERSTILALADFDNDGHLDIVVGRYGAHSLYFWDPKLYKFSDRSSLLSGFRSNPESVAVLDFNQNGLLDLFFGNYYPEWDLSKIAPPKLPFLARGDLISGGRNALLENSGRGFATSNAYSFAHKSHTVSVGVSDINRDGFPDIFEGNEFSPDFLYLNEDGHSFKDVTRNFMSISEHGFAAMNSEFFDFDYDGDMDLYVTNISAYPMHSRGNILWENDGGKQLNNIAKDTGLSKCGFSWAGKFADFDLNGQYELYVINGAYSGASKDSPNYWYFQSLRDSIPLWLRGVPSMIDSNDFNYSGYERNCLFEIHDGMYVNVAESAQLADEGDGRGMALVDVDNNGLLDVVVANQVGPLRIYINESKAQKNWVGFSFKNRFGSSVAIGAAVTGVFKDGRRLLREIYPSNGHNGQSDSRVVVAVASADDLASIEVQWNSGKKGTYSNFEINTYNSIQEGN